MFDGSQIPFSDHSFDSVMFVDVLHHTLDPAALIREAARVTRRLVLIKDHVLKGFLAAPTLRFMDWAGNWGHGVSLPYNYHSEEHWRLIFAEAGFMSEHWIERLGLYPLPFNWIFERRLHIVTTLVKCPPELA
jgi:SAM-dependent methyltransferase